MDQTKLMDAGVFLLKRIKSIIVITLLVALVMVLCNCFLNSGVEETYTLKIAADMTLDSFVTTEPGNSTTLVNNESKYPFDDAVAQYIENAKLSKKSDGRLNPYIGQKRFGVESIQTTLMWKEFSAFFQEKGYKGSVSANVNPNNVTLTLMYDSKNNPNLDSNVVTGYVEEYLTGVMENYINDVRETHTKLLENDQKKIDEILSQYKKVASQTGDVLSNEECRSLLSSYAQVAYNQDVSKAVVMQSDQLLEIGVAHKVLLERTSTNVNNSPKSIAVFGVFGLVIGLVFACFIVYVAFFVKQVFVRAKNQPQQQETAE